MEAMLGLDYVTVGMCQSWWEFSAVQGFISVLVCESILQCECSGKKGSNVLGSVRITVGLDDLKRLFQPKWL